MLNLNELKKPFTADKIKQRVGSTDYNKTKGLVLNYIDARDVMDRLDEVIGAENWQTRYKDVKGNLFCGIGIKINDEWVYKYDAGAETLTEKEKGEASDSFKRAGVQWGIGRFLYDIAPAWLQLETYTNSKGETKVKGFVQSSIDAYRIKLEEYLNNKYIQDKPKTPKIDNSKIITDKNIDNVIKNIQKDVEKGDKEEENKELISPKQMRYLYVLLTRTNTEKETIYNKYGVESLTDLTKEQGIEIINKLGNNEQL